MFNKLLTKPYFCSGVVTLGGTALWNLKAFYPCKNGGKMETLRLPFWAVCPSFRQGTLNNCNPKQGGGLDIWDPLMKRRLLFGGGYHDSNLFPTNPNHQSKPWEWSSRPASKGINVEYWTTTFQILIPCWGPSPTHGAPSLTHPPFERSSFQKNENTNTSWMNSRNRQPKTSSYKTPLVLFCRGKCWWPLFFLGTKERATFFHLQQNTHSPDRYQSIKLFHRNCQTPKVLITTKSSIIGKEATKKDPPRWKGFFNRTPTEPKLELTIISWKNVKTRWDPILIQASNGFPL